MSSRRSAPSASLPTAASSSTTCSTSPPTSWCVASRRLCLRAISVAAPVLTLVPALAQIDLVHARARRRLSRGIKKKGTALLKKLRKAKKDCGPYDKPDVVKTHLRDMLIMPEMIGSVIGVHNGKVFTSVEVKADMVRAPARAQHAADSAAHRGRCDAGRRLQGRRRQLAGIVVVAGMLPQRYCTTRCRGDRVMAALLTGAVCAAVVRLATTLASSRSRTSPCVTAAPVLVRPRRPSSSRSSKLYGCESDGAADRFVARAGARAVARRALLVGMRLARIKYHFITQPCWQATQLDCGNERKSPEHGPEGLFTGYSVLWAFLALVASRLYTPDSLDQSR